MKKILKKIVLTIFLLSNLSSGALAAKDKDYRLAINDLLEISVYQEPDLSKTVRIGPDGTISYPLLGNLPVVDLTAKELEEKLTALLEKDYLVSPQVSVFIKEHAKVYVSGPVYKPGAYEMRSGLTALEAITLAGGFILDKANPRKIKITRIVDEEKQVIKINADKVAEGAEKDINLLPEDEITVDELGTVSVLGQVKNPGRFTLKRNLSAVEAIALAGGLTDLAAANGTKVIRIEEGRKRVMSLPVDSILKGSDKTKDIFLEADDTVVVPESFF